MLQINWFQSLKEVGGREIVQNLCQDQLEQMLNLGGLHIVLLLSR